MGVREVRGGVVAERGGPDSAHGRVLERRVLREAGLAARALRFLSVRLCVVVGRRWRSRRSRVAACESIPESCLCCSRLRCVCSRLLLM